MRQLAQATGKATANLAQTIRPRQMAEQHGDELIPAGETLGVPFGTMLVTRSDGGRPQEKAILDKSAPFSKITLPGGLKCQEFGGR